MGWPRVWLWLMASVGLSGCSVSYPSQESAARLTTGFWFWHGSASDSALSGEPLDSLFVHVGSIQQVTAPISGRGTSDGGEPWHVYGELPHELPAAREYWLVFRFERQGVPDLRAAPMVADAVSRLRAAARQRNLNVAGVQLDIDSPTGALAQYASFLREVRKELPPGFPISITALLDWFRSGTAIAEVIREADEFVPQFYDISDRDSYRGGSAIAAKIDAARWGPVFNCFRKRFRVGVSSFGRARMIPVAAPARSGYLRATLFRDVVPLDIATNPAFQLQTTRNPANELVLSYGATRETRIGYNYFSPGDTIQFILSTPEAIRAAMASVRQMGGHLGGVVFFRWPGSGEALAMQPNEVLMAAGLRARDRRRQNSIVVVDGHCAAVECGDLYFESADPFSPKPARYWIRSSAGLEYFLPEKNMPVRMAGPSQLELSLPPYSAGGRLYLGRAVSAHRSEFTVEEQP